MLHISSNSKSIKKDVSKTGINLKKIIQQSPINILPPLFFAGRFFHKNDTGSCWAGVGFYFMGSAYIWEATILWGGLMGVTLVVACRNW